MIKYGIKFKYEFINDDENALAIIFFSSISENEDTSINLYIDNWAEIQLLINFEESFDRSYKEYTRKDFIDKINPEIFSDIKKFKTLL